MQMRLQIIGVMGVIVLTGCGSRTIGIGKGSGGGTARDMTATYGDMTPPGRRDMSARDLAPYHSNGPYDLAWTACAGTSLANTCVEKFFEPFAACFAPAGQCYIGGTLMPHVNWDNGAVVSGGVGTDKTRWSMGQKTCLTLNPPGSTVQGVTLTDNVYCLGDDQSCWNGDMGKTSSNGLSCDSNGTCTCPDGTQVKNVNFGDCPLLKELLQPLDYLCVL